MSRILLASSCAMIGLLASGSAYAQQASAVPTASDGEGGISEIVVTAQRKQESAQKAAIAIDVVSSDELTNAGVVTPTSLNAAVPSLYVARGGGANTSFFIRGVGNFTNNGFSDPAIAFNLDGVYLGRPLAHFTIWIGSKC
jgi:iron complex outermembrane recepter protein